MAIITEEGRVKLIMESWRRFTEATEYDDSFRKLFDAEEFEQAIALADSIGIPARDLPWTATDISHWTHKLAKSEDPDNPKPEHKDVPWWVWARKIVLGKIGISGDEYDQMQKQSRDASEKKITDLKAQINQLGEAEGTEATDEEQRMYIKSVQKVFPTDMNQALELAEMAGIGDTSEVLAMKGLKDWLTGWLENWEREDAEEFPNGKAEDYYAVNARREDETDHLDKFDQYIDGAFTNERGFGRLRAARPLVSVWKEASEAYEQGPPYRKHELEAVRDLADQVGTTPPTLAKRKR
jgi:hypothetical protein